jgi:hypothetical protein
MNPEAPTPGSADSASTSPSTTARWGRWAGVLVFLFFLVKGLSWLVVPAATAYLVSR